MLRNLSHVISKPYHSKSWVDGVMVDWNYDEFLSKDNPTHPVGPGRF